MALEKGRKTKESKTMMKLKWMEPSHSDSASIVRNKEPSPVPLNSAGVGGGAC